MDEGGRYIPGTDTLEWGEEVAQHVLNIAEASAGWTPGKPSEMNFH